MVFLAKKKKKCAADFQSSLPTWGILAFCFLGGKAHPMILRALHSGITPIRYQEGGAI